MPIEKGPSADLQYSLFRKHTAPSLIVTEPELIDTYDTRGDAEQARMLLESAMIGDPYPPTYFIKESYKSTETPLEAPQDPFEPLLRKLDHIIDRISLLEESLQDLDERLMERNMKWDD